MIQGIIDIGSNTIRMAVYEINGNQVKLLIKKKHTVGLASYIQDNIMQQEGIEKTCEVLQEFKLFLETFKIKNVIAFATAALRNIDNSKEAVKQIIQSTEIDINVISGEEEANFAFIGATNTMEFKDGILMDIGGASTELVLYKDKEIIKIVSLPIGSLAVQKKYVEGLLPTKGEAVSIKKAVLNCLIQIGNLNRDDIIDICGIGGTFKGTYLLNNQIYNIKSSNKHIDVKNLEQIINKFICDSNSISLDKLDILVKVVPERIKTIIPGMIIADTLAEFFGSKKIIYSDSGVREGYIYKEIIGKY